MTVLLECGHSGPMSCRWRLVEGERGRRVEVLIEGRESSRWEEPNTDAGRAGEMSDLAFAVYDAMLKRQLAQAGLAEELEVVDDGPVKQWKRSAFHLPPPEPGKGGV